MSALRALVEGGQPLAVAELVRQNMGTVTQAVAGIHVFGDETKQKIKSLLEPILAKTGDLFAGILSANGAQSLPQPLVASLQEDIAGLALLAESLQIKGELPVEVAQSVSGAQAAIREALQLVERYREESKQTDADPMLKLNQDLLTSGIDMLSSAKNIIDAATTMQDELKHANDHAAIRKYMNAMSAAVDTLLTGVPQWLVFVVPVIKGKGKIEDFQAVTRSISACSAQLVAFVRTQRVGSGAASPGSAGSSVIEKSTGALQSASHKVIATAGDIGSHLLSGMALEEYSKLGANEINKLLLTTQAETLRLEKALEMEREKLGRLRKLQYNG